MGSVAPEVAATRDGSARRLRPSSVRAVLSLALGIAVAGTGWLFVPGELSPPIEVVGYPTFADHDYQPLLWGARLVIWVLPVASLLAYALLRRVGPLADRSEGRAVANRATAPAATPAPGRGSALRLVLPAALVAWAVSSRTEPSPSGLTWVGGLCGLAYVVGVVVLAGAWSSARRAARPELPAEALSRVHAPVAAAASIVALGVFVRGTTTVTDDGQVAHWPWLPWPVVVALAALAVAGVRWALVAGRRRPEVVELAVVAGLAGAVAVFVVTYTVFPGVGPVEGFDDMQSVTGADLLRRGDLPWRDVMLIHGVFEDALRSWAGFALFERSLWATYAVAGALWWPLAWAGLYLLAVWSAPRRWAVLVVVFALLVWASQALVVPTRWVLAPYVFILLGVALRRHRARWTALLAAVLFVEAVLVPEAAFQVLAVLAVLVLSDLRRSARRPWWRRLTTTRDFVATGLALGVVWAGLLAVQGSLAPFVEYYRVFGPGHVESGALPLGPFIGSPGLLVAYLVAMGLVVATLGAAGVLWLSGRPASERHWVMLASALTAGLYGEKALGRADDVHLAQSVFVAIPLAVLWLTALLPAADARLRGRLTAPVASLVALAAILVGLPSVLQQAAETPSHPTASVGDMGDPLIGFAESGAFDGERAADLELVLDALGAREQGLFDFTNSPGYFHYLFGLDPPTRYFHVSMAIPEFTQDDLVDELEDDNPAVVVFDAPVGASPVGLSSWDGVHNVVRHSRVSAFLLSGWTPYVRSHGVLFLLRNDLVGAAVDPGAITGLNEPLETTDLHLTPPACDWGGVPSFAPTQVSTDPVVVEFGAAQPVRRFEVAGWAYDGDAMVPTRSVVVAVGETVQAVVPVGVLRPEVGLLLDLALGADDAEPSGFAYQGLTPDLGTIAVYALGADGTARRVGGEPPDARLLVLPDGTEVTVSDRPALGSLDVLEEADGRVATVEVPAATRAAAGVVTFDGAADGVGRGRVELMDAVGDTPGRSHSIGVDVVRGGPVSVRVGACAQWHGYAGDRLLLYQDEGAAVDRLLLSPFP